ncbi:unnamed protein product [Microthlaspi erraticum]|uniref:Uncharacterized protein n=1 Tax=Microthlaspi erraticum TaxID=1685480 RepID=A0A6D2KB07_9BRAS|nr:unnamed protein product [Microthlaspi erraticum]
MWVLGLHKVHGEESIVVLLVHGELILFLCSASSIGFSWLSCTLPSTLDSPLLLPLHSQSHHFLLHLESHTLLLNKVHSNLKLPCSLSLLMGSFLFLVLLSSLNLSFSDCSSE